METQDNPPTTRRARATNRGKSCLAAEAHIEIVAGIERGLADMRAGRVVPHDQVVAEMRQAINRARAKKAAE